MPRSTGGTYALPLSPFQNGTVIRSSEVNEKFADLGAEMTGSLSRDGNGGMRAPLEFIDGSAAQPAFGFTSDPQAGFWCPAGNTVELVSSATALQRWTTSAVNIYKPLTVTGNTAVTGNLSATGTFSATGNATLGGTLAVTGASTFTGAATVNAALTATPTSGNATAVTGTGNGTGRGASFLGGSSNGAGARAQGVGTGEGLLAFGGSTGPGLIATPGTAGTGATRRTAISIDNGDIVFTDGTAAPSTTTALKNTITATNIPKAWVNVSVGSGGVVVNDGVNIASVAHNANNVRITFAQAFSGIRYATTIGIAAHSGGLRIPQIATQQTTYVDIQFVDTANAVQNISAAATSYVLEVICIGAQ